MQSRPWDPASAIRLLKKDKEMTEETLKERVARLEERDKAQEKILDSIARGIERIEKRLDQPLPCERNDLRLNNLEGLGIEHERRLKIVEDFKAAFIGKRAVIVAVLVFASNLVTGLVVAWGAGLFG